MLGKVKVTVDWFVNPVAQSLWEAMPLSGTAERWGEEYYSDVGIKLDTNKGVTDMTIGDVAYWPPSKAICVFFGPTPASTDHTPKAASPVVRIGRVVGHCGALKALPQTLPMKLERR